MVVSVGDVVIVVPLVVGGVLGVVKNRHGVGAAVVAVIIVVVRAAGSSLEGVKVGSLWPCDPTASNTAGSGMSWLSHREAGAEVSRVNPLSRWRSNL